MVAPFDLRDPDTVQAMLAEPLVEAVRTRRQVETVQGNQGIEVTFHHTPYDQGPAAPHPGPAPVPPAAPVPLGILPVGRPTNAVRDLRAATTAYAAAYPALQAAYLTQRALYDANLALHQEAEHNAEYPVPDLIYAGRGISGDNANVEFLEGFARTQNGLTCQDEGSLVADVNLFRLLLAQFPVAWPYVALGGKSEGAQAAARAQLYGPAKKLIFLTYPLIVGLEERFDELLRLDAETDVLFVVGTQDAYAVETYLKDIRERMTARTWWLKIESANHFLESSGGTEDSDGRMVNIAGQIAAMWNQYRDPALTELFLYRDRNTNNPTWTAWTAPTA